MTFQRRTRIGLLVAAMVGTTVLALPAENASANPQTYTNACRNNVNTTNWDQIDVTMTGTSPAGAVAPGATVPLTGISLKMSIPGAIFVTGYNIGLLTKGTNTIPATVRAVIDAENTVELSQNTNSVDTSLSTTITDPDGTPGTGDERATNATGSVTFADQAWTADADGGTITFHQRNDPTVTGSSGGGVVAVAHIPSGGSTLNVAFRCTAGRVAGSEPGTPTFFNAPTLTSTPDITPPTITATAPSAPFTLGTSATLRWTASDTGSGLASFHAQYQKAGPSSGFGAWTTPTGWGALPASATSVTLKGLTLGYDYCFRVSAKDNANNTSAPTAPRCVARPLDDRALTVSTGWTRGTGTAYWNGTVTSTKTLGKTAKRANVQLDRVGVVATRGPGMGTVGVYVGTKLIGKIGLAAASKHYRSLLLLPKFSLRTGTVTVKVLTSGKPVQLDGLAVSRT